MEDSRVKQKKNLKRLALALLGVGVAAVLVACGGGGGSPSDREVPLGLGIGSAISWTPGTLAFSINPGGKQDVPVTFTSSVALSNVAVTVVPALKNIVSVSPTSFATLQAGQTATVTVKVAPSAAESLRLVEGTIRLVVGTSTVAKPLSVSLTLVAPQLINGVAVPPEPPPELNNATLAGFDTNGNGVRDDVERFFVTRYSKNRPVSAAALRSASGDQSVLTLSLASKEQAVQTLRNNLVSGVCAARAFRAEGLDATEELNWLFAKTYNTASRLSALNAVDALAGSFEQSVASIACN